MMDWIDASLASAVRFMSPILLAALGCLPTIWTKDLNIGLEGAMLFGAFFGVAIGFSTGSAGLAVTLTLAMAALSGLIFGLMITKLNVNIFVAGIVLNIFATGGTVYLLRSLYGVKGSLSDPGIPSIATVDIPEIRDISILGSVLSGQTVLTYLSWVLVVLAMLAVRHTVFVRHLKASGEHPEALATAGGSVDKMRIGAQIWCFSLCGLAGVQLSLGQLSLFTEGMTSGTGFVALAVVIFSQGRVLLVAVMSVLFGLSFAASVRIDESVAPPQFPQMLPYVVAFVGLIILARTRRDGAVRIAAGQLDL